MYTCVFLAKNELPLHDEETELLFKSRMNKRAKMALDRSPDFLRLL